MSRLEPIATFVRHYEEPVWRKVRMTPELMDLISEAAVGRGNLVDWGEPDEDGFYVPTVTISDATLGQVARAMS